MLNGNHETTELTRDQIYQTNRIEGGEWARSMIEWYNIKSIRYTRFVTIEWKTKTNKKTGLENK